MLGEDCLAGEMAFFVCRIWQSCRLVAVGDGVWFERDLQEGGIRRIFGMGAGSFLGPGASTPGLNESTKPSSASSSTESFR